MENGGMCLGYSNVHFGHARNLIQPGRAETMADGWETARKVTRSYSVFDEIKTRHSVSRYSN